MKHVMAGVALRVGMSLGISLGISLALCGVASAQSGGGGVKDEVLAAQKKFYKAYESCSPKEMESLVVDDMLYLHSTGGLQRNKAELLKSLTPNCTIERLYVDVQTVRIYGDTAILFGNLHFKAKGAPAVTAQLLATQVFVKQNGRWLFATNASMESVPLDTSTRLAAHGGGAEGHK